MRTLAITLCVFFLAVGTVLAASTGNGTSLGRIAEDASEVKRVTSENARAVMRSMEEQRAGLKEELATLTASVNAKKSRASELQNRLASLRKQQFSLEEELKSKEAVRRKIQNSVRDNAGVLLAAGPMFDAQGLDAGWREKLALMAEPERFPSLGDVEFLLAALQASINAGGKLVRVRQFVHVRDGSSRMVDVLHLGALQAAYAAGEETGFLLQRDAASLPQAAAYKPDNNEAELVRNAFTAPDGATIAIPADLSGGKLLADPPKRHTLLTTVMEGGLFLWPILLIGVVGILLVSERVFTLSRVRINGKQVVAKVLGAGAFRMRAEYAGAASPAERVVGRILNGNGGSKEAEQADRTSPELMERRLEEAMLDELPPLERFLQTLRVLAAISPLLGLLGTVSGIIQTFRVITAHGNGDPKLLSAGISEALLTTEMGLLVAIPLLLCHHFLTRRVNTIMLDMEAAGTSLIAAGASGGKA
ncbi:MotA/TolQ/ExbB proton channel family protein [Oleidesulfovibrio sp.]|uniref:MotA/TolQ/ExbB proton channel family protein n=1 Tax=Oleidesulfovibrio sp. TaxID=2909707 RepID=UPI003A88101E